MSYYVDDHDPLSYKKKQQKLFTALFLSAVSLAIILIAIQIAHRIYQLVTTAPHLSSGQASLDLPDFSPFSSLLDDFNLNTHDPDLDRPIVLNLDPSLLQDASSSSKPWQLELNVDGGWTKIHDFVEINDLLTANPQMWRYLLTYQDSPESITAFDLRSLENIPLLNLETAVHWLTVQNFQTSSRLPLEKMTLAGITNDQIFVYLANALDEGVLLSASYQDDLNWFKPDQWQVWPHVNGKLARSNGYTFFLQGFKDGCGEVYTFYRLPSLTEETKITSHNQLEKIATTYGGCLEGDRFLGVDSRGRLLLSSVVASSGNGPNLDSAGTYQNVYAVPIDSPQDQILLISNQEMPANINRVAFFPDIGEAALSPYDRGGSGSSSDDSNSTSSANLSNRGGENLILNNENNVWRYNLAIGSLDQVGRLDQLFGLTIPRTWRGDELCLEIINHPELSSLDRLVSVNLETGVAMTGLINCQVHNSDLGPTVGGTANRDFRLQQKLKEIGLPADFQLVRQ